MCLLIPILRHAIVFFGVAVQLGRLYKCCCIVVPLHLRRVVEGVEKEVAMGSPQDSTSDRANPPEKVFTDDGTGGNSSWLVGAYHMICAGASSNA